MAEPPRPEVEALLERATTPRCWLCDRKDGEEHSRRCSVTKFGEPARYAACGADAAATRALCEHVLWLEAQNERLRDEVTLLQEVAT